MWCMANTKSAKKAHEQSLRRRVFNLRRLRDMKNIVKEAKRLALSKDGKARELLQQAYKAIDKAAKRGVIKKNTAARKKSRLTKFVNKQLESAE